jgi:hypothetical protein
MVGGSVRYWVGAASALLLGVWVLISALPDEDNSQLLASGYYTASAGESTALHWHDSPDRFADAPLLEKI